MSHFKLTASIVLVGVVVIFVMQNVTVVEFSFFLWSFSLSRALLIFGVLAIGIVIGWLRCSWITYCRKGNNQ